MSAIDLIVLGLVKKQPQGAYDIQKELEKRNITQCVRISIPAIYKKVLQLENKGYIKSHVTKSGKMPEKAVYQITESGDAYFIELMNDLSKKSIKIHLDINSVIMNLDIIPTNQKLYFVTEIEHNIHEFKKMVEHNIELKTNIPFIGKSILEQQHMLSLVLEAWISNLKLDIETNS